MTDLGSIRVKIVAVNKFSPMIRRIVGRLMLLQFRRFLRRNKGNQSKFISHHRLVRA